MPCGVVMFASTGTDPKHSLELPVSTQYTRTIGTSVVVYCVMNTIAHIYMCTSAIAIHSWLGKHRDWNRLGTRVWGLGPRLFCIHTCRR